MRTNQRAAVIIEKDNKVLFIHRKKDGKRYFILPGGGVEDWESPEEAAIREAKEELSVEVGLISKIAEFENHGNVEHYFKAEIKSGSLAVVGDANLYHNHTIYDDPKWIGINKLNSKKILPEKIKILLVNYFKSFKKPKLILKEIDFSKIRQLDLDIEQLNEHKTIKQNDLWHDNEVVYDHIMNVLEALSVICKLVDLETQKYLEKIEVRYHRKDLLFLAALLHDIGKKTTMRVIDGSQTNCDDHERVGPEIAREILKESDLSPKEIKKIIKMITFHGEIHKILAFSKFSNKKYADFKKRFKDIYLELVLLGAADVASVIHFAKPETKKIFNFMTNFYTNELNLPEDVWVFKKIFGANNNSS